MPFWARLVCPKNKFLFLLFKMTVGQLTMSSIVFFFPNFVFKYGFLNLSTDNCLR